ncbi:MAG: hypothetical protein ACQERF_06170 [Actinomycetota bacterium]
MGPYAGQVLPPSPPTPQRPTITRELLGLAVPALATLLPEPLLILADTWIVGHLGTPHDSRG